MPEVLKFTDEQIQKIFGHEAAEDEEPQRLKSYYFKSSVFEKVTAELGLRVLVGHKGIGKSALFTVAMQEERDRGQLPVLIRPDDIAGIHTNDGDFLDVIRQWKHGLQQIIAGKALQALGINRPGTMGEALSGAGKVLNFLRDSAQPYIRHKVALAPAQEAFLKRFLKNSVITVYVDDLDRGWEARRQDIARISALVNALRDLHNENKDLRFKLSLRSDVYYLVRTSDESTDKIEGSVVWFTWTNHEILALLAKRIETFFGRVGDERQLLSMAQKDLAKFLTPVMEPMFKGRGRWSLVPIHRVLMSLIRKRPRDLVKLCTLAARKARDQKRTIITGQDFEASFEEYSQGRIQDTINEYKSELPDIDRLIVNMKPNRKEKMSSVGWVYKTDQLLRKIESISELGSFKFRSGNLADPKELANFLYKINFLTARKVLPDGEIDRKYFEENRYLSSRFADFGYDWEIHPAYRWALQPDTFEEIYDRLEVSRDG
ncbi:MAG TPA: hypothetical protein VE077_05645 [Candidatus Methylomirabilis sp.]|nr:hypothetical protein [Candidatus Methylomirabilis sp.]